VTITVKRVLCLKFGYSYVWNCTTHKGYLLLAIFGASENCRLLLCLRMMKSKTWKGGMGQVGTSSVGLVGSVCQLTQLRLVTYWLIFYQWSFSLHFKELSNAYLQQEVRYKQHNPWRTTARCESCAKTWKVNKERGEGFSYFANIMTQGTTDWCKKHFTTTVIEHKVHPSGWMTEEQILIYI
jgi:hypothetical protein